MTPSPQPTTSSASTVEPLPSGLDPDIAHAIELRRQFGLRYDLAFVVAAASDPRASLTYLEIPMYPDEDAKFLAERADQDFAVTTIQAYAEAHQDEFGGLYIDRDAHPGFVTVLWAGHLDEHRKAITERLEGRVVIFGQVRYGYAHLQALADQVLADEDWMAAIPAEMFSLGVDIIDNVIDLEVSSAEPTVAQQIAKHYSLGDQLRVTSDGTGAMLIPGGTVKGRVIRPDGRRLGENDLMLDSESTTPGGCGGGDIGYGIRNDGTFEYPCQAGVRTILVRKDTADGERKIIGRGTVTVVGHKTVKLTIKLTENP